MAYPTNNYYSYAPIQSCADPFACKLKVEGRGSVKARPDTAKVVLGVVTEDRQLQTALQENAVIMSAVLESLHENGIPQEDIQTQSYTIAPQYDYVEGKQVFRGYRVEHSLEVTIRNMSGIGKVIDDAVRSGANQVGSIRFSVADPSAYYQQALSAAVDDVLEKAETLGTKLNIAVSKVPVQIIERGYETGAPIPLTYQAAAAATPVQAGLIEISAQIEAVFAYRPIH